MVQYWLGVPSSPAAVISAIRRTKGRGVGGGVVGSEHGVDAGDERGEGLGVAGAGSAAGAYEVDG